MRRLFLVRRDRQTMTALAAAVREHFAAAARLHAGAKPVGADAAKIVGLIRAFAHDEPVLGPRNQALLRWTVKTAALSPYG